MTDGGVDSSTGWLVVGATFISTFTVFGVAYSFGAFFRPMAEEFGADRSTVALVFSITTLLYFGLGVFAGGFADRFGPRPVLAFGGVALVIGLIATSQAESIVIGYLTYGLGVGIGVACAYVPMVACVGAWFDRRRSVAVGVAVAGIGTGTLVVAPVAERLISDVGWRTAYVYMAVGAGLLLSLATIGARRPPTEQVGEGPTFRQLVGRIRSSRTFGVLYLGIFFAATSLFVPFVFLADYIAERNITGSGAVIVGVIGFCSVIGRLGFGALANRVDSIVLFYGSLTIMALSYIIWLTAADRYFQLVAFGVVLGVAYGGFIALSPVVAARLFGTVGLGGVLGALYTAAGIGGFVGPPAAGALIDRFSYGPTLLATVVVSALGAATFALLPSSDPMSEPEAES